MHPQRPQTSWLSARECLAPVRAVYQGGTHNVTSRLGRLYILLASSWLLLGILKSPRMALMRRLFFAYQENFFGTTERPSFVFYFFAYQERFFLRNPRASWFLSLPMILEYLGANHLMKLWNFWKLECFQWPSTLKFCRHYYHPWMIAFLQNWSCLYAAKHWLYLSSTWKWNLKVKRRSGRLGEAIHLGTWARAGWPPTALNLCSYSRFTDFFSW